MVNANGRTATILVVDDTPENLSLMSDLLRDDYRVKVATNGEKALRIAAGDSGPDMILLDVMMPGMDGYEVCRRLKADPATKDIPIIFLTARTDPEDERVGLELGAVDFITKPVNPPLVQARVRNHLIVKTHADLLRDKADWLESEVQARTRDIERIKEVTIVAMASLAETRDNETGNHIRRTQNYVRALAEHLSTHPDFASELTPEAVELLYKSAPLHDIGKVGIPDSILLKPGKLTPDEFEIMKTHPTLGAEAISAAEEGLDEKDSSFLRYAREISQYHHEKWDGSGYPFGLKGDDIPVSGRLMAVADVYDALISKRVYKPAFPHEKAVSLILEGRGGHFDPRIVDAFAEIADRFDEIAAAFADTDEELAELV
ncbi:two-component system response regulator [Rhodospirillaceae bacterium KN72]|uniref:Two-component system response regulator n=1 Tax=Pacificispira spongiicola TaxID=2729598 RepID=A0A7Y0DWI7_9PROT|nr:two-component system response regulator [Pacificispira spongiicola]NMM42885.1 two-component system response regulator [Pacificispira spongiicola]